MAVSPTHADHGSHRREQHPFSHKLPEQAATPGPKSGADGKFTLPGLRASQQQVGEVGARNEQHQHHGALQHE